MKTSIMLKICPYSNERVSDPYLSLLLVCPDRGIIERLATVMHSCMTSANDGYKLFIHLCEKVENVERSNVELLHVDYVVLVLDVRNSRCIKDTEQNLINLRKTYAFTRICLVTPFSSLKHVELGVTYIDVEKLRHRFDLAIIRGGMHTDEHCSSLGKRILNIAFAATGLKTGMPLPMSFQTAYAIASKTRYPNGLSEADSYFSSTTASLVNF